jgi:hypothetical protein
MQHHLDSLHAEITRKLSKKTVTSSALIASADKYAFLRGEDLFYAPQKSSNSLSTKDLLGVKRASVPILHTAAVSLTTGKRKGDDDVGYLRPNDTIPDALFTDSPNIKGMHTNDRDFKKSQEVMSSQLNLATTNMNSAKSLIVSQDFLNAKPRQSQEKNNMATAANSVQRVSNQSNLSSYRGEPPSAFNKLINSVNPSTNSTINHSNINHLPLLSFLQ